MTDNHFIADVTPLVKVLTDCSRMCRSLSTSSALEIASDHALPDLSKLLRLVNDSAASCDIAVLLIERKSHIVVDFLQVCEELTMECAWACSNYGFDVFKECAEACEQAAKACLPYVIQQEAF
jgi:hypothetical protein